MARPKREPRDPRNCRYKPCEKLFVPKYDGQEYCCHACSNRDFEQHRQSGSAKPVYHGTDFTFSVSLNVCLVADAERNRVIKTAQAYGIPLGVCEDQIARLKASGEYAAILDQIKNKWADPAKKGNAQHVRKINTGYI